MTASSDAAYHRAVAARLDRLHFFGDEGCGRDTHCRELFGDPQDWCDACALREAARLLREIGDD